MGRLIAEEDDPESPEFPCRRLPLDLEAVDPGQARPVPESVEERLDVRFRAFGQDLDAAVGKVPDPAGDVEAGGVLLGEEPVGHSLDPAADEDPDPDEIFAHPFCEYPKPGNKVNLRPRAVPW